MLLFAFRFRNRTSLADLYLPWARPLFGTEDIQGIGVFCANQLLLYVNWIPTSQPLNTFFMT